MLLRLSAVIGSCRLETDVDADEAEDPQLVSRPRGLRCAAGCGDAQITVQMKSIAGER